MTTRATESKEVLFGVSLSDLARLHAAERAGVTAPERLSELGIDRTAFSRAEQAWSERLARSLREEPSLFVAYDRALAEALANDAPKLVPLEEDLGAWISFEGHLQRALDPAEMTRSAGLTLAEVARLHRTWAERLAASPALAEEAVRKRAEPLLPLPEIRREPRAPRRPAADKVVAVAAASEAALPAEVSVAPASKASVPWTTETGTIDLAALRKEPLPFDPNTAPSVAPQGGAAHREPLSTGTAPVDLSVLFRGAMPFASGAPVAPAATPTRPTAVVAPPAMQVPPAAVAPPVLPKPVLSTRESTETVELDVRAMLAGGVPLPFQKGTERPNVAAPPAAPAAPPVAEPAKSPPFHAETAEIDPALIAEVLKKGPPPFRR